MGNCINLQKLFDCNNNKIFIKNKEIIEQTFKIVFVGNNYVGKSAILERIITNTFNKQSPVTFIECAPKIYQLESYDKLINTANIQYWDISGSDAYKSLLKDYFKNSFLVILVFSLIDKKSFEDLNYWITESTKHLPKPKFLLVGTKFDQFCNFNDFDKIDDLVEENDINKLQKKLKCEYIEVSSLTGHNCVEIEKYILTQIKCYNLFEITSPLVKITNTKNYKFAIL